MYTFYLISFNLAYAWESFIQTFIFCNISWALTHLPLIADAFDTPAPITFTHLSIPEAADSSWHADNFSSTCISPLYCLKPFFGIMGVYLVVCKHTPEVWVELCSWGKPLTDRGWESVTKCSLESINYREYTGQVNMITQPLEISLFLCSAFIVLAQWVHEQCSNGVKHGDSLWSPTKWAVSHQGWSSHCHYSMSNVLAQKTVLSTWFDIIIQED